MDGPKLLYLFSIVTFVTIGFWHDLFYSYNLIRKNKSTQSSTKNLIRKNKSKHFFFFFNKLFDLFSIVTFGFWHGFFYSYFIRKNQPRSQRFFSPYLKAVF